MNVLLFANVGTDWHGFYHVGDEAMFYETVQWYRKLKPTAKLSAFVSLPSHHHLGITEYIGLPWPDNNGPAARAYCLKLMCKAVVLKFSGVSIFSHEQYDFIQHIRSQERVHFTGGGNITSLFVPWLYYSFLVIFIAWLYGKEVILASQTIGPLRGIDRVAAFFLLNMPQQIWIREPVRTSLSLRRFAIFKPRIENMLDAAYTLDSGSQMHVPRFKKKITLGLSLHSWKHYGSDMQKMVARMLCTLHKKHPLTIVLIPHLFSQDPRAWDLGFMQEIVEKLPANIPVIVPTYQQLCFAEREPAIAIKGLSQRVDVLIASRYHGLVFGLQGNVPCLTFMADEYYNQKNEQLFAFYGRERFLNMLDIDGNFHKNMKRLETVLANLSQEKEHLKRRNASLKKMSQQTFAKMLGV